MNSTGTSKIEQKDSDAVIGCGSMIRFNLKLYYKNKYIYLKPLITVKKSIFK